VFNLVAFDEQVRHRFPPIRATPDQVYALVLGPEKLTTVDVMPEANRESPVAVAAKPAVEEFSAPWLRFVVLSLPRTGSTYLKTTMDQHPNVIANGEILNPKDGTWQLASRMDASCAELLRLAYDDFPDKHQKTDIRAVGFKLHDWHTGRRCGRTDFFELLAADRGIRVLHLIRENLLEGLRSHEQAHRTGRWVAYRPEHLDETAPTVHLSPRLCVEFFQRAKRFTAKVRAHFGEDRVLPLTYERLLADPDGEFGRIHEFLGVPLRAVERSYLFKQEPRPLAVTVENFAELRTEFRGTPYARFFE
jgi:LPS sulfotransferase NodH